MKVFSALILGLSLLLVGVKTATVLNPLIWSDVPDIDVIRVKDTYYMISTTMFFNPGAPIMKSKNMVSWEICNYVYDILETGDAQSLNNGKSEYSHGQWAASLRYHEGIFYVFFCSFGSGHSYIFKTDDIEKGKWEKITIPVTYHDASMFFDDDGKKYLIYGVGDIHIKEFNDDMTDFKKGGVDKQLLTVSYKNGLRGEGSHFYKIGDYYYEIVIAWPSGRRRIMTALRSKQLLGKYEEKEILDSPLGSYDAGVAQGAIFDTPDGKWYALLFQDHGSVGRVPCLVPCTWKDGWPMLGVNGKALTSFEMDVDKTTTVLAASDDFDYETNSLNLLWQWNHNPDNKSWSVTERKGFLRLYNNNLAKSISYSKNTLTMRTEGPSCSSYILLDTQGMKPGDYAGLSAFQWNYGNVGVYIADNGAKKVYMSKNGSMDKDPSQCVDKIIKEVNCEKDLVYLKIDFHFSDVKDDKSSSNNIDKANFYYSYDGKEWTKIGEELSMTYDLKYFIGYRSGIYSYPTKEKGGYADIDTFHYERKAWN